MTRILFFPGGNSLSHLSHCYHIAKWLSGRGHKVFFGISRYHAKWAKEKGIDFEVVPELWEPGGTDYPTVSWFIDRKYIVKCIQAEIDLIESFKPDIVVSDFKFTVSTSVEVIGIDHLTLGILSMLKSTRSCFGFLRGEDNEERQRQERYLEFFYEFATKNLNCARRVLGLNQLEHLLDFVEADRVLVHDLPEFHCINDIPNHYEVIGPICNNDGKSDFKWDKRWGEQVILVTYGTTFRRPSHLGHILSGLSRGPWTLLVSSAGLNAREVESLKRKASNAVIVPYCDIEQLVDKVALMVCHGGLCSIFDAIYLGCPALVIPTQPEQDHNGRLCEAHGIGTRLWKSQAFPGRESFFQDRLLCIDRDEIFGAANELFLDKACKKRIIRLRSALSKYGFRKMTPIERAGSAIEDLL